MAEGQKAAESGRPEADGPAESWFSAYGVDLAVFALVAASLFVPIVTVGLWDPFELDVAEASRRIAVNLLGAEHLKLDGALNNVPIRRELGRGELPFTSIALGFRFLGLSDWAGRLPLALWALLGVLATYSLVSSLSGRRVARLAALLMAATPLYFVHARTLSGDAVTMAALAIAVRGLTGAVWGGQAGSQSLRARAAWLLVGATGLYAGFWARGVLIGVAVPLLGVGLGWLAVAASGKNKNWLAYAVLLAGVVASFAGVREALRVGQAGDYSILLGTRIVASGDAAFHDSVLQFLAHGAFPSSALLPFGVAHLFTLRRGGSDSELVLRATTLGTLILAFAVHGFLAPFMGPLPFSATFACAVAVALLLADLGDEGASSRALGFGVVALTALLLLDFEERPEKVFSAFVSTTSVFPSSLSSFHRMVWFLVASSVACVFLFALADRRAPRAPRFAWRADYRAYLLGLKSAYGGNLWFVLWVACVGFAAWALLIWASDGYLHIPEVSNVWSSVRRVAYNAWWVFPAIVFALPVLVIGLADLFRSLRLPGFGWFEHPRLSRLRLTRTTLCAGTLVASGFFLSLAYYPRLMSQLSPKQVFVRYQALARNAEPLGLLRMAGSAADYYAEGRTVSLESVSEAFAWLDQPSERRFLMVHASELPELNAMFRRRSTPARNLPVIDARSSEILLVSNRLGSGEENQNPFAAWMLSKPPKPAHPLKARLGSELEVLGWELRDEKGELASEVFANVPYELVIFYEVTGSLHVEWDTFVHIDGYRRRYNGDHETLRGEYPLSLLRRGDFIADIHVIELGPNFTPGTYRLYFGLYRDSRRMEVTRGKHDDDRILAGSVRVR